MNESDGTLVLCITAMPLYREYEEDYSVMVTTCSCWEQLSGPPSTHHPGDLLPSWSFTNYDSLPQL